MQRKLSSSCSCVKGKKDVKVGILFENGTLYLNQFYLNEFKQKRFELKWRN